MLHGERNHALDAVKRCANFMAHLAEEVGAVLRHGEGPVALGDGLLHLGMSRRNINRHHKYMGFFKHVCKP